MTKFRKKPVEVEAVRWVSDDGWPDSWIPTPAEWRLGEDEQGAYLAIPTLNGVVRVREDDWIVRGVAGEFYPCRADIFEVTYEPVNDREATK